MKKALILIALLGLSAASAFFLRREYRRVQVEAERVDTLNRLLQSVEAYTQSADEALRRESCETLLLAVRALNLHHLEHGTYPDTLETLFGGAPPDLIDAWQTPLRYTATGDSFTFHAAGPDRLFDTADDLSFTFPDEVKK